MDTMTLRIAHSTDAPAISALICNVAPYLTPHPPGTGAEQFLLGMAPPAIARYVTGSGYHYQLGMLGSVLVGVIAISENRHVFHLYVAPAFHHRGVARRMWHAAKTAAIEAGNTEGFTVNSSPYARPMYERFGFVATGPEVAEHGIAYVPMRLQLE